MKTGFISLNTIISEWLEDSGSDTVDDSVVRRWAMSVVRLLTTDEQLCHRVTLIDVKNYKTLIPNDFKMLCEVAYRKNKPEDECTTRKQISQWVQEAAGGHEIEINLKCPRCKDVECKCDSPIIEVDIDRINEMAHPEYYYSHFHRVSRWGEGKSVYNPKFTLMQTVKSGGFRSTHLSGCQNLHCNDLCSYSIKLPYLETSFPEGEILLSYLGYRLDEDGGIMVPDHPDVSLAVFFFLEWKAAWIKYRSTKDRGERTLMIDSKGFYEEHIGAARSALQIPDAGEFDEWVRNSWLRRLPNNHYEKYSKLLGTR